MRGKPASRTSCWAGSATLAVSQAAQKLKAEGRKIYDFGVGEPDFATPENICEAARRAMAEGKTHYTATAGILPLREVIAKRYRDRWGGSYATSEVVVGCGAKHLLWESCFVLFEPGDQVLLPTPAWVSYPEQIQMVGAQPVMVPATVSEGFLPDPERLRAAVTPATKGIVLNSPSNPTGAVMPREILDRIADLAIEKDLYVLFDETYDLFVFDGAEHYSLAARKDLRERLVIIHSVSKTYAMTGWRIGFALGPGAVMGPIETLQSQMTSNACSVAQWAAVEALAGPQDSVAKMQAAFSERREIMVGELSRMEGVRCPVPRGAFYAMPDISSFLGRPGLRTCTELATRMLLETGVVTVPGEPFGAPGTLRLSYACSNETLRDGLAAMRGWLARQH